MPGRATAQGMPVYDNTNFISLAKQLVESAKQTSQLLKTVEFLQQQKERIEQVSSVLQQLNAVQELIQNNQQLFHMVQNDLQEILNSPYIKPGEIDRITDSFNDIIERSMESVDYVNTILSSGLLKMEDAERAKVLKDHELKSKEMVAEIQAKTRRYREIISFRKMQDRINNRETNY
ncbi:MAG: conjugal transfer protein [Flavobacteriia bacterium]|nr:MULTISPECIES: conjugal transfer protein [Allomuricauda]MAU14083.1 conjugal transfer protein [Allomuricauda sp.]MBW8201222.1 type IV secretion system protein [Allomuricauda abyssi]RUA13013.1 MAG: conjugal transfer protein [Flavobacteriia bacterium]